VLGLRGANAQGGARCQGPNRRTRTHNCPRASRSCRSTTAATWSNAPCSTVTKALGEAIVLVVVLLLLFLGNLRAALVVALMLPWRPWPPSC
jgi:cobalt-zinc-cadmium resistance protein CzcA